MRVPGQRSGKATQIPFPVPRIAIITGIAWNPGRIFPTFDLYLEQVTIFIQKIEPDGLLIIPPLHRSSDRRTAGSNNHNLLNLHAARYVCCEPGINATDFVQAVTSRTGIEMHADLPKEK